MISINIRNLTKKFGDTVALSSVNLEIHAGEIFFLLGPSGCGKTTLLRNIAGFYTPEEGQIFFNDKDVTHLPAHKRNTGMMFQSYALWPHMTVEKNVAFGLAERKVPKAEIRKRVGDALASVRMEKYGERKINQLSGGQQQRVALARALVIRPNCLLLDEPLSNLDAKLRLEMRTEIRRVCKAFGLTAVYVTHDQKEALSISDRMAILENGIIRQVGTPQEVYRRPNSTVVADFIGETNFMEGEVVSVESNSVSVATPFGVFAGILTIQEWIPRKGERVTLSIRPESWTFCNGMQPNNTVGGRIGEVIYLGEVAQYRFHTHGGEIKVFEMNPQFIEHSKDREIFASVNPSDVVILRN